jgi:hypothetical protein
MLEQVTAREDQDVISPDFIERIVYAMGRELTPEEMSLAQGIIANSLARYASTLGVDTRDRDGLETVLSTLSQGTVRRIELHMGEEAPDHWLLPTRERVVRLSGNLALRSEGK